MKKIQRIFALVGVLLLVGLYGSTMFFALSGSPNATGFFKASIACTIVVPVFLYANMLIYKYLKNKDEHIFEEQDQKDQEKEGKKHD